jgi:hypothetical protein
MAERKTYVDESWEKQYVSQMPLAGLQMIEFDTRPGPVEFSSQHFFNTATWVETVIARRREFAGVIDHRAVLPSNDLAHILDLPTYLENLSWRVLVSKEIYRSLPYQPIVMQITF